MESIKGPFHSFCTRPRIFPRLMQLSPHPHLQLPATLSLSCSIWSLWVARRRPVRRLYTRCNFLVW
jgi:hypothetical protein